MHYILLAAMYVVEEEFLLTVPSPFCDQNLSECRPRDLEAADDGCLSLFCSERRDVSSTLKGGLSF